MPVELGMRNYNHLDVYLFYFASRYAVIRLSFCTVKFELIGYMNYRQNL